MVLMYAFALVIERRVGSGQEMSGFDMDDYQTMFLRSLFVTLIAQTFGILIQTVIPYYTLKKNLARFSTNNTEEKIVSTLNNVHTVSLLDVLSHKSGFFLLMDQLVQELSFENLSFLIEVYQFRYVETQDMTKHYKRGRLRSYFRKRAQKRNCNCNCNAGQHTQKQNTCTEHNQAKNTEYINNRLQSVSEARGNGNGVGDENINTLTIEPLELDVSVPSNTTTTLTTEPSSSYTLESDSVFDEYSAKKDFSDRQYYSRVLGAMPWYGLPLTASITCTKDKLVQATNIYNKYIIRSSYDSVNCSYMTMIEIEEKMRKLSLWKQLNEEKMDNTDVKVDILDEEEHKNKTISGKSDVGNNVDNLALKLDLDELDNIKNETEWIELLLNVFNAALPDIFANLEDSMTRFRYTKEFMSLIGSKQ